MESQDDENFSLYSSVTIRNLFEQNFIKLQEQINDDIILDEKQGEILSKNNKQTASSPQKSLTVLETESCLNQNQEETLATEKLPEKINDDPDDLEIVSVETNVPLRRTRNQTKLERLQWFLNRNVPAKVTQVPDIDEKDHPLDEDNYEVTVKILWKSVDVKKVKMRRFQPFSYLLEILAKEENIPAKNILLKLHEQQIFPMDTPETVNLQICDFIDGGVVAEDTADIYSVSTARREPGTIDLRIHDAFKNKMEIQIRPEEPMRLAMIKFAERTAKKLGTFKFILDGEAISPTDTAKNLGLEHNDLLEIVYS